MNTQPPRRTPLNSVLLFIAGGVALLCICGVVAIFGLYQLGRTVPDTVDNPAPRPTRTAVSTSLDDIAAIVPTVTPTTLPLPTVGEVVEAGGVSLVVNSLTAAATSDILAPAEGNFYLILDATITNVSRDDGAAYSPLYFSVKDSDGFEYEYAFVYFEPAIHAGNMPLSDKVRGNVAFEIPLTTKDLTLTYDPIVIGGGYEQIRVKLGDPPTP